MTRFFTIVLISTLSGCSFWNSPPSSQLVLNISAAPNINPNVRGEPSPLEIRIYQLTDGQAFKQADFVQLYNDPQGVLKTELLLARQLKSISPNESRQELLPLSPEIKYIGIIAGFADYGNAKGKLLYKPTIIHSTVMNINIDGINISASGK